MLNWNTDEKRFKREDPEGYRLWRLEQLINYGLKGEKLDPDEVKWSWPKIKENIDPFKRRLTEFILWGKLYSLPSDMTFWNQSAKYRCPACKAGFRSLKAFKIQK